MKTVLTLVMVVSFSLSVLACGKKGGGSDCDKIVDHQMKLAKELMKDMPDEAKKKTPKKADLVKECEAKKYTKEQVKCFLGLKDIMEMGKCEMMKKGGDKDKDKDKK